MSQAQAAVKSTRTLVGHVDPASYPDIEVNIAASVTTPAAAAGEVPVIIQWGGGGFGRGRGAGPRGAGPGPGAAPADAGFANGAATWQEAAISLGWGYGVHGCVGRVLATMEAQALLGNIVREVESIELAGPYEPWMTTVGHGPIRQPVKLAFV